MPLFCQQCGTQMRDDARFCTRCSAPLARPASAPAEPEPPPYQPGMQAQAAYQPPSYQPSYLDQPAPFVGGEQKSKLAAGLLGILLGWLGIHRFYLGYNSIGIAQLVLGVLGFLTCGITSLISFVWGVIDGIMIFNGSIATDAQGRPLKE